MKITKNNFVWLPVTDKAKEVFSSGLFNVYKLHDDGSESLCQSYADINDALECGLELAIAVGHLNKICVDIMYYEDDNGKNIYDYEEMHNSFELSMSELDPKQYSETSR